MPKQIILTFSLMWLVTAVISLIEPSFSPTGPTEIKMGYAISSGIVSLIFAVFYVGQNIVDAIRKAG